MKTFWVGTDDDSLGSVQASTHLNAFEVWENRSNKRRDGIASGHMENAIHITDGDDLQTHSGNEWHAMLLRDAYGDDYRARMDHAQQLVR